MDADRDSVLRLFPAPSASVPLHGLYLQDALRPVGTPARPCVYASFIASLDGRIALPQPGSGTHAPPSAITNPRDWRLFQELAAAADAVVTSGRYVRDLAAGAAQDVPPLSDKPEFADLHAWRRAHGLAPQPAIVIVTQHADLPIPETLVNSGRRLYVATGAPPARAQAERLDALGVRVLVVGTAGDVDGRALVAALTREGFGTVDMTAGAALLRTLLVAGVLDRLYLTQACRALGGESFDTWLKGARMDPPVDFRLRALHCDAAAPGGMQQLFSVLDVEPRTRG